MWLAIGVFWHMIRSLKNLNFKCLNLWGEWFSCYKTDSHRMFWQLRSICQKPKSCEELFPPFMCVCICVNSWVRTVLTGIQADARFHWLDTSTPLPSNVHLQRRGDKTVSTKTDTNQLSSSSPCYHAAAILNRWYPNSLSCLLLPP